MKHMSDFRFGAILGSIMFGPFVWGVLFMLLVHFRCVAPLPKRPSDEPPNPYDFLGKDTFEFNDSVFIIKTVIDTTYEGKK